MPNGNAPGMVRYKQVRNRFWLGFVALWVLGWYLYLNSVRAESAAEYAACTQAGRWLCSDVWSGLFALCMLVVVLTSPLMFVPARYAAQRAMVRIQAQEAERATREREEARRRQQQESERRIADSEADANKAREKNSRSEIIMKLGSINDLVDVMAVEKDQQRMMNIRLGVAQALRELAAKYEPAVLGVLIQSDETARITVRSVIRRLEQSSLADMVELELLKTAAGESLRR